MQRKIETFITLNKTEQKKSLKKFDVSEILYGISLVEDKLKELDIDLKVSKDKLKFASKKLIGEPFEWLTQDEFETHAKRIKDDIESGLIIFTDPIDNFKIYVSLKDEVNSIIQKRKDLNETLSFLKHAQFHLGESDLVSRIKALEKEVKELKIESQRNVDQQTQKDRYAPFFAGGWGGAGRG